MCKKIPFGTKAFCASAVPPKLTGKKPPALSACQHTPFPVTVEIRRYLLGSPRWARPRQSIRQGRSHRDPTTRGSLGKTVPCVLLCVNGLLQRFSSLNCSEYTRPRQECQGRAGNFGTVSKPDCLFSYTMTARRREKGPNRRKFPVICPPNAGTGTKSPQHFVFFSGRRNLSALPRRKEGGSSCTTTTKPPTAAFWWNTD